MAHMFSQSASWSLHKHRFGTHEQKWSMIMKFLIHRATPRVRITWEYSEIDQSGQGSQIKNWACLDGQQIWLLKYLSIIVIKIISLHDTTSLLGRHSPRQTAACDVICYRRCSTREWRLALWHTGREIALKHQMSRKRSRSTVLMWWCH